MNIIVDEEIKSVCPEFVGACVEADVVNSESSDDLWAMIAQTADHYRQTVTTQTLKDISAIAATRRIYKACGKDPSRYRPSSEALIRRMLQGKELYHIDTLVDLINLASITYGYSIGGFDADKLVGDTLTLGIGREGEPYEGICRSTAMLSAVWALLRATTSVPRWSLVPDGSWLWSMATTAMSMTWRPRRNS